MVTCRFCLIAWCVGLTFVGFVLLVVSGWFVLRCLFCDCVCAQLLPGGCLLVCSCLCGR